MDLGHTDDLPSLLGDGIVSHWNEVVSLSGLALHIPELYYVVTGGRRVLPTISPPLPLT